MKTLSTPTGPNNGAVRTGRFPDVPETLDDLGLPPFLPFDLALRFLRDHGSASLMGLRRGLHLSYQSVEALFEQLRQQQLIDVKNTVGRDYFFSLTMAGQRMASERSAVCRYAGPMPVSLEQYTTVIRAQGTSSVPSCEKLAEAFADLVLPEKTLDQLGPALISRRPIFVYGPSGNGKTSVIERLAQIYDDDFILVPYAVEADTQIISVFDPLVHRAVPDQDEMIDPRWVLCRRPSVMAGGELVAPMLALRLDERSGVYAAPLQMKANNGLLLIDDFGRQAMSPRELFNRWILPLDRRIDYLSLEYGFTFQIPFELTLAFATNLDPRELADEAFLRRVPNKIFIGAVEAATFDEIWERVLQSHGIPFERVLAEHLRAACLRRGPGVLRGCYPADIAAIIIARAAYRRQPLEFSRRTIDLALETYFAESQTLQQRGQDNELG